MEEKKQKITVDIFGEPYSLKSNADVDRVKRIARLVDQRMSRISRANPRLSPVKVAVLAALNLAEEILLLEEDYQQLIKMVKEEEK
jgi:cell division protein ZapA